MPPIQPKMCLHSCVWMRVYVYFFFSGRWTECVHLMEWKPVHGAVHGILVWKCVYEHYQPISIDRGKTRKSKKRGKAIDCLDVMRARAHTQEYNLGWLEYDFTLACVCEWVSHTVYKLHTTWITYRKIFRCNEGKKLDFDDVVERAECMKNERQKRSDCCIPNCSLEIGAQLGWHRAMMVWVEEEGRAKEIAMENNKANREELR